MGSSTDSTYLDVLRALNKQYSSSEGWEVERKPTYGAIQPEYVLLKRGRGKTERVLVGVAMDKKISKSSFEELATQAASMAKSNAPVSRAVMVVPAGAVASDVPAGVEILPLASWQVVNNRIVWAKNLEKSRFVESERQRLGMQ